MNKAEYMNELANALERFDTDTRNEIVEDYEAHFAEAAAQGIDEEAVIRELGSIEELIAGLNESVKENTGITIGREIDNDSQWFGFDGNHYIDGAVIGSKNIEIVAAKSNDDMFHLFYQELNEDDELYQEERDGILYAGIKEHNTNFFKNGIFGKLFKSFFGYTGNEGEHSDTSNEDSKGDYMNALAPYEGMDFGPGRKIIVLIPDGMKNVTLNSTTGNINVTGINCEVFSANTTTSNVKINEFECRDFSVKDISGYVEVISGKAETLKIKNVSGSIKSEKISGQRCEQESVSGSVNSELCFNDFSVKTTSGSVYVGAHNEIRECRMSSVSGACMLKLYDEKNLTANVSSVSGGVNLTMGAASVNGKGNHVFGTGKAKVNMNTVSGSIKIC